MNTKQAANGAIRSAFEIELDSLLFNLEVVTHRFRLGCKIALALLTTVALDTGAIVAGFNHVFILLAQGTGRILHTLISSINLKALLYHCSALLGTPLYRNLLT